MILAIDFDGTLVSEAFPDIGIPDIHLIDAFIGAKKKGYTLILYTCRCSNKLSEAISLCDEYGLFFDKINENIDNDEFPEDSRKIGADFYYDNRSFNWDRDAAIEHIRSLPDLRDKKDD